MRLSQVDSYIQCDLFYCFYLFIHFSTIRYLNSFTITNKAGYCCYFNSTFNCHDWFLKFRLFNLIENIEDRIFEGDIEKFEATSDHFFALIQKLDGNDNDIENIDLTTQILYCMMLIIRFFYLTNCSTRCD